MPNIQRGTAARLTQLAGNYSIIIMTGMSTLKSTPPDEPTHIPDAAGHQGDILDMAIAKNIPQQITVETIDDLGSDHLPIKITLAGTIMKAADRTCLNYEGANWQQFSEDWTSSPKPN